MERYATAFFQLIGSELNVATHIRANVPKVGGEASFGTPCVAKKMMLFDPNPVQSASYLLDIAIHFA